MVKKTRLRGKNIRRQEIAIHSKGCSSRVGRHPTNRKLGDVCYSEAWSGVSYAPHAKKLCEKCGTYLHKESGSLYCPTCDDYVKGITPKDYVRNASTVSPRLSQSDVAKLVVKADPKADFDPEQVKMGVEVELEHTSDPLIAEKIARDHLRENPKYYSFLKQCAKEHGVSLREDSPFAGFESWRKKPFPKAEETQMEGRASWELGNMKKALESLPILNSDEDNERLWRVREELRRRRNKRVSLREDSLKAPFSRSELAKLGLSKTPKWFPHRTLNDMFPDDEKRSYEDWSYGELSMGDKQGILPVLPYRDLLIRKAERLEEKKQSQSNADEED